MLMTMEETHLERITLTPEATLLERIAAVCEAQARLPEPRKLNAAFTTSDTVVLVFTPLQG